MTFFDLSKRRTRRHDAESPEPQPVRDQPASVLPPVVEAPPAASRAAVPFKEVEAIAPIERPAGLHEQALALLDRGQDVLVVGAGLWDDPGLADTLMRRARGVTIVDPDPARLARLRPFCQATLAAELEAPEWREKLEARRFDVVIAGEILGQAADPAGCLRDLRSLLRPEGYAIAIVPNVAHGDMRLALLQGDFPRDFAGRAAMHHYNRERLRELLAFSGYAVAELRTLSRPLFDARSQLVPELFPEALLKTIGQETDLAIGHFVAKAVPASPTTLLRELFDEQATLRRLVRIELARATRTHDALSSRLVEADEDRDRLRDELEQSRRNATALNELARRAEHNVRRLGDELDDLAGELGILKGLLIYKLFNWLLPKPTKGLDPADSGPEPWKYDDGSRNR